MKTIHLLPASAVLLLALQGSPLQAARSEDSRIVSTAKDSYVYKTYLKSDHVRIRSTDGNVVLTGDVADPSHKAMAEDTVRNLPGVVNVDNEITIKRENAPSEKSDSWLEFKVKSALVFHRSVSAAKTKVTVRDGVVTLTGTAASQAQKDLTTEYANDIEGVRGVNNMLTVAATASGSIEEPAPRTLGHRMDDASITAQVKSALVTHRSTSALRTEVKTRDGVVVISGRARNEAEKDLVTKLVNDINGVRSVENVMIVE